MRSRKDFEKEFELVVKQEIKNYNDTVLATNIALEKCRSSIEELSNNTMQRFSEQENKFLAQDIALSRIKDSFDKSFIQLGKRIDDLSNQIDQYRKNTEFLIHDIESAYLEKDDFCTVIKEVRADIDDIRSKTIHLKDSLQQGLYRLSGDINSNIEILRREIFDGPSEAEAVKADLSKKLDAASIDFLGLMKEITICKKESFITEKKIENLYTLIERINNRIGPCPKQA
jgi:chromosome segregation ATPase